MKKWIEKLDQKYLKICLYAAVTVLITVGLGALIFSTGGFWLKLWTIITAVLKPIIIGGIISYLFSPVVNKLEGLFNRKKKHKWARGLSVLLTFLMVLIIVALIVLLIVATVYRNVESINIESVKNLAYTLQNEYQTIWNYFYDKIHSLNIQSANWGHVISIVTNIVKSFMSGLIFGVIFAIYFMMDGKRISTYWERVFRVTIGKKNEDRCKQFIEDADRAFSGYIRGQFVDAMIIGVLSTIALLIGGIPSAILVGLFVAIGNMIPYVGPIVGYFMVIIVCIPSASFDKMAVGIIILTVLMFIDGNIINPKLLSNAVSVHPLLVVAALIAGGAIGGIVGMIVAVPTAALIKLQFDRYIDKMEGQQKHGK